MVHNLDAQKMGTMFSFCSSSFGKHIFRDCLFPLESILLFVQLNYADLELNRRPCNHVSFKRQLNNFGILCLFFLFFWVIKWLFLWTLCSFDRFIFRILVVFLRFEFDSCFFLLSIFYFLFVQVFRTPYAHLIFIPLCWFWCIFGSFSIQLQLLFGHLHCYLIFISFAETIDHFQKVNSDCKWSAHQFDENESSTRNADTHTWRIHIQIDISTVSLWFVAIVFQWQRARTFASQTIKRNNRKSVS